jgi:CubicO group peptidase (beta-lactamase class C family)
MAISATTKADQVDHYLRDQMAKNHIPGLAVAVVRDGKVIKANGYGQANLEWPSPVSTKTRFQLASATKPFTGTALMLLVQEGKLSLDDPVTKHLPEAPAAWQSITLRHLASHTAGLKDDLGHGFETAAEAVKLAAGLPLDFTPGERASYGITGYLVLTHIIEKVSGKPFPAFMRERLFGPLGMDGAAFDNAKVGGPIRTSDPLPNRASSYAWGDNRQTSFDFLYPVHSYSAGGLYASADDFAKWAVALDQGRFLSSASLQAMWSPMRLAGGGEGEFATGWALSTYRGKRTVGHSGGPALADVLRFPDEKLTIVVLCNQQRMFPYLAQGIADLYVEPPAIDDKGIEDADPTITAELSGLLRDFGKGNFEASRFTPEAQRNFLPTLNDYAVSFFRSLKPLRSLTLLETRQDGENLFRRYRAMYGDKPVHWMFVLDRDRKIVTFKPTPE